jgi:hypothetical protein
MAVKKSAPETFRDKLAAIIDAAPALRNAGVTSVGGEIAFTLAPPETPEPRRGQGRRDDDGADIDIADLDAFRKRADAGGAS